MKIKVLYDYKDLFPGSKGRELTDRILEYIMAAEGTDGFRVKRTEKGKPYDPDKGIHFSVSHTGNIFACVISHSNVGLDIQGREPYNMVKLAERFFTGEESSIIMKADDLSRRNEFLRLWTRKEALTKYLGVGLTDIIGRENVIGREDVRFLDFELEGGIKGALCVSKEEEDNEIQFSYGE